MKILMQPIEMIQFNDKDGTIKPFRIKVPVNETESETYNVTDVLFLTAKKEEGKYALYYRCKVVINDVQKNIELRFNRDDCNWFLYRV